MKVWISVLFLLLCLNGFQLKPISVFSQYYGLHPYDARPINLGYVFGLNYNRYNLKEQIQICENGICLDQIKLVPRWGLNMAMIVNVNVHPRLQFRFIPGFSLEQRDFNYYFADSASVVVRHLETFYFNMPFLFQYRAKYWNRTRFYVLGGPQIGINLASDKKVKDNPDLLKIRRQDLSIVVGCGLNIYTERLKLSPEIRYAAGLINIYEPQFTTHAHAIGLLYSQVLSLVINFE